MSYNAHSLNHSRPEEASGGVRLVDVALARICERTQAELRTAMAELEVERRLAAEVRARREELARENETLAGELARARQDAADLREQLRLAGTQGMATA